MVRDRVWNSLEIVNEVSLVDPSIVSGEDVLRREQNVILEVPRQVERATLPGLRAVVEADLTDRDLAA